MTLPNGTACMHMIGINSICLSQLTSKNEKIKVVSNWLKWREKLSEMISGLIPRKKCGQHEKKSKLSQIGLTGEKIGRQNFSDFLTTQLGQKNQSYSKLTEMPRKLVGN